MPNRTPSQRRPDTTELLSLGDYEKIVVAFSGGKDSLACVLHMLELGVPREKLVLWHHSVDGAPGESDLMDWPVTESYCRAIAGELGVSIRFSWKVGGFERELFRKDSLTAPTTIETEAGEFVTTGGTRGKKSTRRKFPQKAGDLSVRWCSAYLKIDVGRKIFSTDPAYRSGNFLFVTGERREESSQRDKYAEREREKSSNKKRRVDHWRAVIDWKEGDVWEIIRRWNLRPHPAYRAGFGRVSCMFCIFGKPDEWATLREMEPARFERIARLEEEFKTTIDRKKSVREQAQAGTSYAPKNGLRSLCLSSDLFESVRARDWKIPAGAFKRCGGPQ